VHCCCCCFCRCFWYLYCLKAKKGKFILYNLIHTSIHVLHRTKKHKLPKGIFLPIEVKCRTVLYQGSKLPVSMDQSIECQSVSPAGGKVLDLHSIIPEIKCTWWLHDIHCTICHDYRDTFQTSNSDNYVTTLFGHSLVLKKRLFSPKCKIHCVLNLKHIIINTIVLTHKSCFENATLHHENIPQMVFSLFSLVNLFAL